MEDIINDLNSKILWGVVKFEGNILYWYFNDENEDQDILWNAYCEDAKIIRNEGFEVFNSWQDNDSCGFDFKPL